MMHRRIGQVVALHAVLGDEARAARFPLGELVRLESGWEDALEHRPVGALGPAPFGLLDELRGILGGGRCRQTQGGGGQRDEEVHPGIILGTILRPA